MGFKVYGPDLESIEQVGIQIERFLKDVAMVEPLSVVADRIVGKPYFEIDYDRKALARYGMSVADVQEAFEVSIGGVRVTTTVEKLQRFPVRVRYQRELRDSIETMERMLIPARDGTQIPLSQVAEIRYFRGPESVKREGPMLVSYVLFDKKPGYAEVDVVQACENYLKLKKEETKELIVPTGVTFKPAGTYENQLHARRTLILVIPLTLFIIFMIIYFQFRSVVTTTLVFCTIFVCWGGGLLYVWCYSQPWFLDFSLFGVDFRDLFNVHVVNMSVAIWVGFLALFGIASDDAVVICTYLEQRFAATRPGSIADIREATVFAGNRRIKACLMTTATTVLALLPVLTSTGRGSDIMVPMALPGFGGMVIEVVTMFLAPVLYCAVMEWRWRHGAKEK
jgi:Cu(I)/Ag(I) efflux system membrane protein CusA/SilA